MKFAILVVCGLMCSCQRISDWATGTQNISPFVARLETADRMVIQSNYREHFTKETAQPDAVAAVLSLVHSYPTGWKAIMSGAGGDYDIYFYRGNQLLGDVGLSPGPATLPGQDTVFVGGAVRQVPRDDVMRLTTKLGLKWPTR
jgi:hypothetical protein